MTAYITEPRDPLHLVALDGPPNGATQRRAVGTALFQGWRWHVTVKSRHGAVVARRRVLTLAGARRVLQRLADEQLATEAQQ